MMFSTKINGGDGMGGDSVLAGGEGGGCFVTVEIINRNINVKRNLIYLLSTKKSV